MALIYSPDGANVYNSKVDEFKRMGRRKWLKVAKSCSLRAVRPTIQLFIHLCCTVSFSNNTLRHKQTIGQTNVSSRSYCMAVRSANKNGTWWNCCKRNWKQAEETKRETGRRWMLTTKLLVWLCTATITIIDCRFHAWCTSTVHCCHDHFGLS